MRHNLNTTTLGRGSTLQIFSINIVASNGQSLFLINRDCDFSRATDSELENILTPLGLDRRGFDLNFWHVSTSALYRKTLRYAKREAAMQGKLMNFLRINSL